MIKLKNVTLEGPDLSGKTTLMSQIHKKTNNKYNIIDRSVMSALVYSMYYDRPNVKLLERQLRNELNDLNNFDASYRCLKQKIQ
jgi:thymidylate kinase